MNNLEITLFRPRYLRQIACPFSLLREEPAAYINDDPVNYKSRGA